MSAVCNVLGSTPDPFPGEDTKRLKRQVALQIW